MADKQINIKVKADADTSKLDTLENKVRDLKKEKLELKVEAKTEQLNQAETKLNSLKETLASVENVPPHLRVNVDDTGVDNLKSEILSLENKTAQLRVDVEMAELDVAKSEIESLDGQNIDIQLNNQSAMEGIEQISQGFDRLRQGAAGVADSMGEILASAGNQEMNKAFLELNLPASQVKSTLSDISSIVANMPGDDTALQGLLSQAAAQNAGMTKTELQGIATAATDYFSAMSFYGKSAVEAQQDMTNYILSGNTAELERSPILQDHIDKLKEGNTVQERTKLLQDALNESGWAGISQQDTYNNKLDTFMGMVERGKYTLGGLFQEGAKGAMQFALDLDEATGGLVGMSIAAASFASPLTDTVMGMGQIAMGMKAIKDLGFVNWLRELEIVTKLSAVADYLLAGAQAVLNAVMDANVIVIIVLALIALAAALIWAYQNVDWFREMVDNAWASIVQFAEALWGTVMSAITTITNQFNNFTNSLGLNSKNWIEAILAFILFIPQLPMTLGRIFIDAIAKALGFGSNFTANMKNGAMNAVNGFINWIKQMGQKLQEEFNAMLEKASQFAMEIADRLSFGGASMVAGWISGSGEHSPGFMYQKLLEELNAMVELPGLILGALTGNISEEGMAMVNAFTEAMLGLSFDELIAGLMWLMDTWNYVVNYIMTLGGLLPANVQITGNQIIDNILRVLMFIFTLPGQLLMIFTNIIASTLGFGNNFAQNLLRAGSNAVSQFISSISRMPGEFANELANIINQALNFAGQIGQILWNAGVNAITGFLGGLDRHSPGIMQREFRAEIKEMGEAVPEDSRGLISNVSKLGSDIVGAWDNPSLDVGNNIFTSGTGNVKGIGGDTIINVYGDVDNEKRVQEIVDAVRRELSWDNTTAGRTV